jgi:PAS domain S-box-containing protein
MADKPSYEELGEKLQALEKVVSAYKHSIRDEQRETGILDHILQHVIYHDTEMNVRWANQAACDSVGMTKEGIIGRRCYELWARGESPCEDCPVTKARDTGKPQTLEKMTPDGRWWYIQAYPIRDDHGHITGAVELSLDITERKKAEEALRKAKDELELRVMQRTAELEKLNEALTHEVERRKKFEFYLKAEGDKVLRAYEQRDYLSRRLVDLLEKERTEIGNALHDEIGQIMAGITMHLEELKQIRTEDGSSLADRVEPIQKHLREAVRHAKGISNNLRSEVLERFGLIPSIRELVDETQKQYDIKIHLFTKNVPEDFKDSDKGLTLYRILQEALTNIHKHSDAKEVFISLIGGHGKVCLTVEDDGVGFDYSLLSKQEEGFHGSLGITIMRERTSMVGGTFHIETGPGKGTHILAEIPCESLGKKEPQGHGTKHET